MTRAEMRRQKRESEKEHTITYNLTKAQLDQMVNSLVQKQMRQMKQSTLRLRYFLDYLFVF